MSQAARSVPGSGDTGSHSLLVTAGIFLSRIAGLVRDRVFAHYFGNSDAADAFRAALRIPNFLQNLFGEGVLSASFIPVYARLRARGREEDADRVAGAVLSILACTISFLVLAGMAATPWIIGLVAPGFHGEKRALTIRLVRILFPGSGFLALSAWCLGILNSHRRFFLSYAAPVVWNLAIIAALNSRIGRTGLPLRRVALLWAASGLAAAAWGVRLLMGSAGPVALALPVLAVFGTVYMAATHLLRIPEAAALVNKLGSALKS